MPTYDFQCLKCDKPFEVIESIKAYSGQGTCPSCGNASRERIFSSDIQFIGAAVESAEYNPAFGQVVKNKAHRNELAKAKGLIEIGNEKPASIHKHSDQARAERLKKSWDEV